jgi:hypothetical protein
VQITVDAPRDLRVADDDDVNLVVFRSHVWCHNEDCGGDGHFFSSTAYGMTQTYPEGSRGTAVRGADIELNAVNYAYGLPALDSTKAGLRAMDIDAALLHEIGHALGLPDACSPEASNCIPESMDSAMYAPGKTRDLTVKDVQAVCTLYPRSSTATREKPCCLPTITIVAFIPASAAAITWLTKRAVLR